MHPSLNQVECRDGTGRMYLGGEVLERLTYDLWLQDGQRWIRTMHVLYRNALRWHIHRWDVGTAEREALTSIWEAVEDYYLQGIYAWNTKNIAVSQAFRRANDKMRLANLTPNGSSFADGIMALADMMEAYSSEPNEGFVNRLNSREFTVRYATGRLESAIEATLRAVGAGLVCYRSTIACSDALQSMPPYPSTPFDGISEQQFQDLMIEVWNNAG